MKKLEHTETKYPKTRIASQLWKLCGRNDHVRKYKAVDVKFSWCSVHLFSIEWLTVTSEIKRGIRIFLKLQNTHRDARTRNTHLNPGGKALAIKWKKSCAIILICSVHIRSPDSGLVHTPSQWRRRCDAKPCRVHARTKIIVENGKHLLRVGSEHSSLLKANFGIKVHASAVTAFCVWQTLEMSKAALIFLATQSSFSEAL